MKKDVFDRNIIFEKPNFEKIFKKVIISETDANHDMRFKRPTFFLEIFPKKWSICFGYRAVPISVQHLSNEEMSSFSRDDPNKNLESMESGSRGLT